MRYRLLLHVQPLPSDPFSLSLLSLRSIFPSSMPLSAFSASFSRSVPLRVFLFRDRKRCRLSWPLIAVYNETLCYTYAFLLGLSSLLVVPLKPSGLSRVSSIFFPNLPSLLFLWLPRGSVLIRGLTPGRVHRNAINAAAEMAGKGRAVYSERSCRQVRLYSKCLTRQVILYSLRASYKSAENRFKRCFE